MFTNQEKKFLERIFKDLLEEIYNYSNEILKLFLNLDKPETKSSKKRYFIVLHGYFVISLLIILPTQLVNSFQLVNENLIWMIITGMLLIPFFVHSRGLYKSL